MYEIEDVLIDGEGMIGIVLRDNETEDGFAVWYSREEFETLKNTKALDSELQKHIEKRLDLLATIRKKTVEDTVLEEWKNELKGKAIEMNVDAKKKRRDR